MNATSCQVCGGALPPRVPHAPPRRYCSPTCYGAAVQTADAARFGRAKLARHIAALEAKAARYEQLAAELRVRVGALRELADAEP